MRSGRAHRNGRSKGCGASRFPRTCSASSASRRSGPRPGRSRVRSSVKIRRDCTAWSRVHLLQTKIAWLLSRATIERPEACRATCATGMLYARDEGEASGVKPELERLAERTQLQLPSPGAAVLTDEVQVFARNAVRIEKAIRGLVFGALRVTRCDSAVDDNVRDMNIFRRQLARHGLCQRAQAEFTHGECGGLRECFHARGRAGEHNG